MTACRQGMVPMRGANRHEQEGRYPGLRMDVTISRVRSTENRVIVSSAVSLYCEYFI